MLGMRLIAAVAVVSICGCKDAQQVGGFYPLEREESDLELVPTQGNVLTASLKVGVESDTRPALRKDIDAHSQRGGIHSILRLRLRFEGRDGQPTSIHSSTHEA